MEEKITIYKYIASNRPMDAHLLLNEYGSYRRARDVKELEGQLKHFVRQNGSKALQELGNIHPDKELLEEVISLQKDDEKTNLPILEKSERQVYSNVNGSSMTEPQTKISDESKEYIKQTRIMIFGSLALLGVAILLSKK